MRTYVILKDKRQVIGIDHYGGKSIRAIAKCTESDIFSETIGKELVDARLNYTIAKKRCKKMYDKLYKCKAEIDKLTQQYNILAQYALERKSKEQQAYDELFAIEEITR